MMQYDEKGSGYNSTPTMHKSPEEKEKKKRLVKTVKMRLRCMHETTVSMVPTPRPPATAPRVPASRAQSLPQTPPPAAAKAR
jgi:hypothetical protein